MSSHAFFEKVSRFKDIEIEMPARKTMYSAGYDFVVAEDVIVPPYEVLRDEIAYYIEHDLQESIDDPIGLDTMAAITKKLQTKPTLVSTGMKCFLPNDEYLELSVRSSCPLKNWLILANSVGIIDADYYNNPDNEGEIFFQIINLSPVPIYLKRGDRIGQGIIKHYDKTGDDKVTSIRSGGMGSTGA